MAKQALMSFTADQLKQLLANAKAEGVAEAAAAPRQRKITKMKVSEKGALSVYGLGRFPVTLYQQQWQVLLDAAPQIKAFIEANKATLSSKDE